MYSAFGSVNIDDDPDLMRSVVSEYLDKVNQSLLTHREECIEGGTLPPNAEVVELRLGPRRDCNKFRDQADWLFVKDEEKESYDGPKRGECCESDSRSNRFERY